jgi:hypothetical protein
MNSKPTTKTARKRAPQKEKTTTFQIPRALLDELRRILNEPGLREYGFLPSDYVRASIAELCGTYDRTAILSRLQDWKALKQVELIEYNRVVIDGQLRLVRKDRSIKISESPQSGASIPGRAYNRPENTPFPTRPAQPDIPLEEILEDETAPLPVMQAEGYDDEPEPAPQQQPARTKSNSIIGGSR